MKKIICAIILIGIVFSIAESDDLADAKKIALNGYKAFLAGPLSQDAFRQDQGLSSTDKLENAVLGEPFLLQSLTPDSVFAFKKGKLVLQTAVQTKIYMFPVLFDGVIKLFLDVSKYGTNTFEIGSLGQGNCAVETNRILAQYPVKKGYTPILIQNFQTHKYFVHIPQMSKDNLTLVDSQNRSYSSLNNAENVLENLSVELKEMLK